MRGIDRYKTTKWFRKCPKCGKNVYYKDKYSLYTGVYNNKPCWECKNELQKIDYSDDGNPMFGKHHTIETKNKLKLHNTGKKLSAESVNKMKLALTGLKRSELTKNRIRESKLGNKNPFYNKKHKTNTKLIVGNKLKNKRYGENNPFYGKHHTDIVKEKLRECCLNRIKTTGTIIAYNKESCNFFNYLNKSLNWNGLHALNGGEQIKNGYSIDYYNPFLNIIVEWDEERHYDINNSLKQKDLTRQTTLLNKLNCGFYRIRELTKKVIKVDKLPTDYSNNIQLLLNDYYKTI